jgi:hypothetical protein
VKLEPAAAAAYAGITDEDLLDDLDKVLDGLETDPGQPWLRTHRWSDPPVWGVTLPRQAADLLVAWTAGDLDGGPAAVVRYIGPA